MSTNKVDLSIVPTQELLAEWARRRSVVAPGADLSAMELALEDEAAVLKSAALAEMITHRGHEEDDSAKRCPRCGTLAPVKVKKRPRQVRTLSGLQILQRNYHYCEACRAGWYPLDDALGLPESGEVSREVEKRILDLGVSDTFAEAAQRWEIHYGWSISENLVRRVVERVGRLQEQSDLQVFHEELQPVPEQPASLLVVGVDGSMLSMRGEEAWREAKVGVVSREETPVIPGKQGAESRQARYVAVVGSPDELKEELGAALSASGAQQAQRIAWVGDGAPWVWRLAEQLSLEAIQILDWRHVQEHVMNCGKAILGEKSDCLPIWKGTVESLLWKGETEVLLHELEACLFLCNTQEEREALLSLKRYCSNNAHRMKYAAFREAGLPVGSGIIESAHRHVLQQRMKRAGQHGSPKRAHGMARLRAAYRTAGPTRFHSAIYTAAARSARLSA